MVNQRALIKTSTIQHTTSATTSVSRLSLCVLSSASILAGVWAFLCLTGALVTNGPTAVALGFFSALGF